MSQDDVLDMAKKTPRPRTARRAAAQASVRATERVERLTTQLPGGSPAHALRVTSASVVEVRARSTRCSSCHGEVELHSHVADAASPDDTRRVELWCRNCRAQRRLWFRIESPTAN
jgi:hypothetical protein